MRSYTRRNRTRGAGYVTSQQMFNPDVLPPHTTTPGVSTAPTDLAVRPVLNSTFKVGGSRRYRGGFSPSIMGSFIDNAQRAIVPLVFLTASQMMPKKARNIFSLKSRKSGGRRSRRGSR